MHLLIQQAHANDKSLTTCMHAGKERHIESEVWGLYLSANAIMLRERLWSSFALPPLMPSGSNMHNVIAVF
jgi:hypothetical protein